MCVLNEFLVFSWARWIDSGGWQDTNLPYLIHDSKGCLSLFNLFIDMRTTVRMSISCGKNLFLLENFNKDTFFSMKWTN